MQILIVGVKGDAKLNDAITFLLETGQRTYTVHEYETEEDARVEAERLAGVAVRVPHFFWGEPTAKGTYPRERAGGIAKFRKTIESLAAPPEPTPDASENGEAPPATRRPADPAKLVETIRKLRTEKRDLLDRIKGQGETIAKLEAEKVNARKYADTQEAYAKKLQNALYLVHDRITSIEDRTGVASRVLGRPNADVEHASNEVGSACALLHELLDEILPDALPNLAPEKAK